MQNSPLVSIGVPIYNDAPWLVNALEHLLAQEYQNLEIILADDGSTDGSQEICREYASRDGRIHYFDHKHNLGALWNHKFVFDVSKGEFFAWASGHDYLHPSFVSLLSENLLSTPSLVMCCSQSVFVDEDGKVLRTTKGGLDTQGASPAKRFMQVFEHTISGGTANIFYGLYRRDALSKIDLTRKILGGDVVLLGELSLVGEITQVNEILYYRLLNRSEIGDQRAKRHIQMLVNNKGYNLDMLMPYVGMLFEYLQVIDFSALSLTEKEMLYGVIWSEVNRVYPTLNIEMEHFLGISKKELEELSVLPDVQAYRAGQVLQGINRIKLIGLDAKEISDLSSMAERILREHQASMQGKIGKTLSPFDRFKQLIKKVLYKYEK